ncbi:hypothetical protein AD998_02685 [bacterium 336/3]|nr:hypothetical protein AD998_02685 [bacterium 336/3]
MLSGLKILIFSILLGNNTPEPYMSSEVEFLGFFGGNKYCYMRNTCLKTNGWELVKYTTEFVVKDFNGNLILREITKKEKDSEDVQIEYLGKTDIIDFLRKNNVQKYKHFESVERYSWQIEAEKNTIYQVQEQGDNTIIVTADKIIQQINIHNQEPIFSDYIAYFVSDGTKLQEIGKKININWVIDIYKGYNKYLLIIRDTNDEQGYIDVVIIIDSPILDKIFKR